MYVTLFCLQSVDVEEVSYAPHLFCICAQVCFPDGVIPDDVEVSPLEAINIDMTPLPAKPTVFIDFSKKGYD